MTTRRHSDPASAAEFPVVSPWGQGRVGRTVCSPLRCARHSHLAHGGPDRGGCLSCRCVRASRAGCGQARATPADAHLVVGPLPSVAEASRLGGLFAIDQWQVNRGRASVTDLRPQARPWAAGPIQCGALRHQARPCAARYGVARPCAARSGAGRGDSTLPGTARPCAARARLGPVRPDRTARRTRCPPGPAAPPSSARPGRRRRTGHPVPPGGRPRRPGPADGSQDAAGSSLP